MGVATARSTKMRLAKILRYSRVMRKKVSLAALVSAAASLVLALSLVFSLSVGHIQLDDIIARFFNEERATLTVPDDGNALNVAMVFDEQQRLNYSSGTIRSLLHYAKRPIALHVVAPLTVHSQLESLVSQPNVLHLYDISLCKSHVAQIWFIAKRASLAELCSLFLADILPPLENLLYIDARATTIVEDITSCTKSFGLSPTTASIAATVDTSETCSSHPHYCYPLAFDWQIPKGLVCGATPVHAKHLKIDASSSMCRKPGEREPVALHPGVMSMNLLRMRDSEFTANLVKSSLHTWRSLIYRDAERGASDLLNNYLRLFPETLTNLPCGCNYQFTSSRRDARCPGRQVRIARGDERSISKSTNRDPYARHFNYWRRSVVESATSNDDDDAPPQVPKQSLTDTTWTRPEDSSGASGELIEFVAVLRRHEPGCSQQPYVCGTVDREDALRTSLDMLKERVYILTRTSGRPFFFSQTAASVSEQTHPYVTHLVGTDDEESANTYLRQLPNVVRFTPAAHLFDPDEVCRKCATKSEGDNCARAPPLTKPKERQMFFDCFCSTGYPMNGYMNALQAEVRDGWMVYLDDDNVLSSRFAISELVAAANSRDTMLAFRSHLGRATPTEDNFRGRAVVMGDFDSSNFAVHSRNIVHSTWSKFRCGDFRLGSHLAGVLPTQWVDRTFIHANPLRAALGGLGGRADVPKPPVTVVLTSYQADGWRPKWCRTIVLAYTRPEMAHLVARVVLVWNNVGVNVPDEIVNDEQVMKLRKDGRFVIVRNTINSLNNRWIATLPHIDTDMVLNLDDDVYVKKDGLVCMISWLRREPTRMVGPFVRRVEKGGRYVLDELLDSSKYSVVLPRVLLVPTKLLQNYSTPSYTQQRQYVDSQEAHCDDILLNLVALENFKKPPLRVLLPEDSIVDLYDKCWPVSKALTGGLGLQKGRTPKRTECVKELMRQRNVNEFKSIAHIATCLPQGNALAKVDYLPRSKYSAMKWPGVTCGDDDT